MYTNTITTLARCYPGSQRLPLLFFFPLRRGAAGLLLEMSQAVRKTVMPRGRSECRVRADSVVAPQHSRSPPRTSTHRRLAGISKRHLALGALRDGVDTEPGACCSSEQHNGQTICFQVAERRPCFTQQQLEDRLRPKLKCILQSGKRSRWAAAPIGCFSMRFNK